MAVAVSSGHAMVVRTGSTFHQFMLLTRSSLSIIISRHSLVQEYNLLSSSKLELENKEIFGPSSFTPFSHLLLDFRDLNWQQMLLSNLNYYITEFVLHFFFSGHFILVFFFFEIIKVNLDGNIKERKVVALI